MFRKVWKTEVAGVVLGTLFLLALSDARGQDADKALARQESLWTDLASPDDDKALARRSHWPARHQKRFASSEVGSGQSRSSPGWSPS